jgi:hypothetical protein
MFGSVDHRLLCSGTRDLHPRPYFLLCGLGEIGYQGVGRRLMLALSGWHANPSRKIPTYMMEYKFHFDVFPLVTHGFILH